MKVQSYGILTNETILILLSFRAEMLVFGAFGDYF